MTLHLQDNIDRIVDRNSAAYLTLTTFREAAKKFFGLKSLPLIQTQDVKREVRRRTLGSENDQVANVYPYSYFNISSMAIDKTQFAVKTIGRASMGMTFDDLQNAMVKQAYMFPCTLQVELHFVTNDLIRAIDFSTRALIVSVTGKLNSRVELDGVTWVISTAIDGDSISFPRADKDLEEDPEGYDITITATINSKLGVMRDVPKINNYGHVTTDMKVKNA